MHPLPVPGADSTVTQKASVWRDIFVMLSQWRKGEFTKQPKHTRRGTIWIKNNTGRNVTAGEFLQVAAMTQSPDTSLDIGTNYTPILTATQPTWHTAVDNLVISDGPILKDEFFPYQPRPFGIVSCTGAVGSNNRFVSPQPGNTKYGIRASSGLFRVLGYDSSTGFAIVDLGKSQTLWRYELSENSMVPATTQAKLLTLNNEDMSAVIHVTDKAGITKFQLAQDQGFCVQIGNEFHATLPDAVVRQTVTDVVIGTSAIIIERKNVVGFGSEDIDDEVVLGTEC